MAILSQQLTEGEAAALPPVLGLSALAAALPARLIWDRIEGWTGQRFGVRSAEWHVTGDGYWQPAVAPYRIDTAGRWNATSGLWLAEEPDWQPDRGYSLGRVGLPSRWRFVGTVGSDALPGEPYLTAYLRYAEYIASGQSGEVGQLFAPGVSSITAGDGAVQTTIRRDPNWLAAAWQASGAADALRYHRRAR